MIHQAQKAIKAAEERKAEKEELIILRNQVTSLNQQNSLLQSELQQKQNTINAQINQLNQKEALVTKQSIQIQKYELIIDSHKNESKKSLISDQSNAEILGKDQEIHSLKLEIAALKKEENKKDQVVDLLNERIEELKVDKNDLKKDKALLISQNDSLKHELNSLHSLNSPERKHHSKKEFYSHQDLLFKKVLEHQPELEEITVKPKDDVSFLGDMSSFSIVKDDDF